MESLSTMACSSSNSMTSPRWPSARLASLRNSVPDLRQMTRPQGAPTVVAAASLNQFGSVPVPSAFKVSTPRQLPVSAPSPAESTATWLMQNSVPSVIQTTRFPDLSLQAFIRNPLQWLMNLVCRLQSVLAHMFAGPQARASIQASADSSLRASVSFATSQRRDAANSTAPSEAMSRRCSSGRYSSGPAHRGNEVAPAPVRLVATQAVPVPAMQSRVPVAAFAVTTAAALACGSFWLYRRWREMVEKKREQAQRAAVKKDNLARQKQRFQRALVVDSVNLELPPIKDMDVQPSVRVEKIIPHNPSQSTTGPAKRSSGVPGLAGESLKQWQQFMAASRAKEVTNVSGNQRGARGAAEQAADRPYVALDDRMLADLSDRIRRANEMTAAGEIPPPMPVITFEQLYANNTESDEAAMARRAAERKARWQKQHQGTPTSAPAGNSNVIAPRPPPVPPLKLPTATPAPASKPRPQAVTPENPFAVGLFNNSTPSMAPSAASPGSPSANALTTRISSGRGGTVGQEPCGSATMSRGEAAAPSGSQAVVRSSPPGRASGRNPFLEPAAKSEKAVEHGDGDSLEVSSSRDTAMTPATSLPPIQPVDRAIAIATVGSGSAFPAAARSLDARADVAMPARSGVVESGTDGGKGTDLPVDVRTSGSWRQRVLDEAEDTTPRSALSLEPLDTAAPDSCAKDLRSHAATSMHSQESDGRRPLDDGTMASPGRTAVRRAPAAGHLRTPESQAPALKRLMRRPGSGSPIADAPKSPAAGDESKGRASFTTSIDSSRRGAVADLQLSEVAT